jgi:hypothetical protein
LEVKKLKSKVAYRCDVSGNFLVKILVVLQIPTTRLKMDSKLVRKMKTHGDTGLRFIYHRIGRESVYTSRFLTCKMLLVIFLN